MPAIADYEKSIDLGAIADACSCDPYGPLLGRVTLALHNRRPLAGCGESEREVVGGRRKR
jgi:hypothetical protein